MLKPRTVKWQITANVKFKIGVSCPFIHMHASLTHWLPVGIARQLFLFQLQATRQTFPLLSVPDGLPKTSNKSSKIMNTPNKKNLQKQTPG